MGCCRSKKEQQSDHQKSNNTAFAGYIDNKVPNDTTLTEKEQQKHTKSVKSDHAVYTPRELNTKPLSFSPDNNSTELPKIENNNKISEQRELMSIDSSSSNDVKLSKSMVKLVKFINDMIQHPNNMTENQIKNFLKNDKKIDQTDINTAFDLAFKKNPILITKIKENENIRNGNINNDKINKNNDNSVKNNANIDKNGKNNDVTYKKTNGIELESSVGSTTESSDRDIDALLSPSLMMFSSTTPEKKQDGVDDEDLLIELEFQNFQLKQQIKSYKNEIKEDSKSEKNNNNNNDNNIIDENGNNITKPLTKRHDTSGFDELKYENKTLTKQQYDSYRKMTQHVRAAKSIQLKIKTDKLDNDNNNDKLGDKLSNIPKMESIHESNDSVTSVDKDKEIQEKYERQLEKRKKLFQKRYQKRKSAAKPQQTKKNQSKNDKISSINETIEVKVIKNNEIQDNNTIKLDQINDKSDTDDNKDENTSNNEENSKTNNNSDSEDDDNNNDDQKDTTSHKKVLSQEERQAEILKSINKTTTHDKRPSISLSVKFVNEDHRKSMQRISVYKGRYGDLKKLYKEQHKMRGDLERLRQKVRKNNPAPPKPIDWKPNPKTLKLIDYLKYTFADKSSYYGVANFGPKGEMGIDLTTKSDPDNSGNFTAIRKIDQTTSINGTGRVWCDLHWTGLKYVECAKFKYTDTYDNITTIFEFNSLENELDYKHSFYQGKVIRYPSNMNINNTETQSIMHVGFFDFICFSTRRRSIRRPSFTGAADFFHIKSDDDDDDIDNNDTPKWIKRMSMYGTKKLDYNIKDKPKMITNKMNNLSPRMINKNY